MLFPLGQESDVPHAVSWDGFEENADQFEADQEPDVGSKRRMKSWSDANCKPFCHLRLVSA